MIKSLNCIKGVRNSYWMMMISILKTIKMFCYPFYSIFKPACRILFKEYKMLSSLGMFNECVISSSNYIAISIE